MGNFLGPMRKILLPFIAQHLPGIHHLQFTRALERRPGGGSASGGNDQVGALALYQGMAYEQIGRRRGYYPGLNGREDAIVMRREL